MLLRTWAHRRFTIAVALFVLLSAAIMLHDPQIGVAQEQQRNTARPSTGGEAIARGAYIVNNVAMCPTCHTPRTADGQLNRSEWLQGGAIVYLPAKPTENWPLQEPRIGGTLPTSDEGMITLLTTAVWIDGTELRDPMPKFHMTRSDAQAVVAYLHTIRAGQ